MSLTPTDLTPGDRVEIVLTATVANIERGEASGADPVPFTGIGFAPFEYTSHGETKTNYFTLELPDHLDGVEYTISPA